jgi:hypothetical protein
MVYRLFSGGREWYLVCEEEKVVVGCSSLASPLILLLEMWDEKMGRPWSCSATSAVDYYYYNYNYKRNLGVRKD